VKSAEDLDGNMQLGNDRFKDEVELLYDRRVRPAKMGRPKNLQTNK